MKRALSLIITLCAFYTSIAQPVIKPLAVGDKMPDITIQKILRNNSSSIKIGNIKGKVIILDFWATWCGSCITALPTFDSLQHQFKDKLIVIPVSDEKESIVNSFINRLPSLKGINLPFATEDRILSQYFPHRMVPHDIIIDQNGNVAAITSFENINQSDLKDLVISGKPIAWTTKNDRTDVNPFDPFAIFKERKGLIGSFIITRFQEGILAGASLPDVMPGDSISKITATDVSLTELYKISLLHSLAEFPDNRVIANPEIERLFKAPPGVSAQGKIEWFKRNSYCVALLFPISVNKFNYLYQQLVSNFNITGEIKELEKPCYVLTTMDSTKFLSKTAKKDHYADKNGAKWIYKRASLTAIIDQINYRSILPLVNETGFGSRWVDLSFTPSNINNPELFNSELREQGLELKLVNRKLKYLVFEPIVKTQ